MSTKGRYCVGGRGGGSGGWGIHWMEETLLV